MPETFDEGGEKFVKITHFLRCNEIFNGEPQQQLMLTVSAMGLDSAQGELESRDQTLKDLGAKSICV